MVLSSRPNAVELLAANPAKVFGLGTTPLVKPKSMVESKFSSAIPTPVLLPASPVGSPSTVRIITSELIPSVARSVVSIPLSCPAALSSIPSLSVPLPVSYTHLTLPTKA